MKKPVHRGCASWQNHTEPAGQQTRRILDFSLPDPLFARVLLCSGLFSGLFSGLLSGGPLTHHRRITGGQRRFFGGRTVTFQGPGGEKAPGLFLSRQSAPWPGTIRPGTLWPAVFLLVHARGLHARSLRARDLRSGPFPQVRSPGSALCTCSSGLATGAQATQPARLSAHCLP